MLPPFSLLITRLPPEHTTKAHPMPSGVREINSPLAHRLHLIHRTALLRKMVNSYSNNAQGPYKNQYDEHVRFEQRFAKSHYVLIESPPLLASVADCIGDKGHSKLLPRRRPPYPVISGGHRYAKINQNTVGITYQSKG